MTISGSAYLTPVSYSVPYDNSTDGFVANNVQAAIEEALASAGGLQPYYLGSGLVINYKAGRAWVNGTLYSLTAGTITVAASLTNNFIYLSTSGSITSGASIPSNAVPIAQFTSGASTITTLTDIRGSLNNNVDFGLVADIEPVVYTTAVAGATNRFADAGHQHVLAVTVLTTGQITASQTLSTTTPTQMTSMTLTTPAAGTYYVDFGCTAQTGTGGNSVTVYVYLNTTATGESRTIQFPTATLIDSGYPFYIGISMPVTVSGSQSINIYWSTTASAAQQSTVLNRRLTAIRTS